MRKSVPLLHFRHYATYRKLRKKFQKNRIFFSIFSFLRAFVVSSCRKSGFRVFLSLRYDADLGRSRLVNDKETKFEVENIDQLYEYITYLSPECC